MKKNDVFHIVLSYENFCYEKTFIEGHFLISRKKYVLLHEYLETGFSSIVAFSNDLKELLDVRNSHPRYGSSRHNFLIRYNLPDHELYNIKDKSLINICKNVAEFLSVAEYAMLKKSFFKSSAWFDKAKNSASLGADILDNY